MDVAFDHAVIVVPSLAEAVAAYAAAGFTVTPGGHHDALPTANALVAFADGGYLELLAPRDDDARESLALRRSRPGWDAELRRASAIGRRFLPRLVGPAGVADFVLRGARVGRFADESRARGFPMTGPAAMSRERADGARLEWTLALPASDALPFLIEDVTPRELRVPSGAGATVHANGALGVAGVTVRVADVMSTAFAYADLFDAIPRVDRAGRTVIDLSGLAVTLVPGAPERAVALSLRGADALAAAIVAHGVAAAESAD